MRTWLIALSSCLILAALAGCISDSSDADGDGAGSDLSAAGGDFNGSHKAYNFPVHASLPVGDGPFERTPRDLPAIPSSMRFVSDVGGVNQAGGIATIGNLALFGGRTSGPMEIVDISDPANPQIVGSSVDTPVRDADPIVYPDGRVIVITTAGGLNIIATDITDPANPRIVGDFQTPGSNHNIAVVPGTPIVYNSGKDVVDFSDPENPIYVRTLSPNDSGCHDWTFFISQEMDKFRGYCAGYPASEIWDIEDPKNPVLIHSESYPDITKGVPVVGSQLPDSADFPLSFSHLAMVNHDATVMIVGDETGGGAINGCDVYADTPAGTVSGPLGNLWFYDITDETNPILAGYLSPSVLDAPANGGVPGSCTAHFGRLIGDTGFLVMGFYDAGVTLVDFRDIDNPTFAAQYGAGGGIWDVWVHDGHLYTGDMTMGMQVLSVA